MVTDEDGFPITIQVFRGNTADTEAFTAQTVDIAQRFKISKVSFVADRGAMKSKQLAADRLNRINAATAKIQIRADKLKTSKCANPQKAYDYAMIQRHQLKVDGFVKINPCE